MQGGEERRCPRCGTPYIPGQEYCLECGLRLGLGHGLLGTLSTAWPMNRNGYTVVLESIPVSAGRSLAVDRARAASRGGLAQVGVLNSSLYSSLHPGYWVVFSGIYASSGQADAAAQAAKGKGFGTAYSRQITR